jgi:hypothetical protein
VTPRSLSVFTIVFAVVFAVAYIIVVESNYALFTYHPAVGEWGLGVEKAQDGPAMYWFGWLATTTIIASIAGALATLLPEGVTGRLWPGWTWVSAVGVMLSFCYLLGGLFLR